MNFRDEIEKQALAARREMVATGELLRADEFRKRLVLSERRLAQMLQRGDVFTIEVDAIGYFPTLLATPGLDLRRLYSICRLLVPAPPSCRLGYLSAKQGNLGGNSPLESLGDKRQYRLLRAMARAYAAEWSRTVVTVYTGRYTEEPTDIEPTLTAADEADPRVNLWKRVEQTPTSSGYIRPCGPYPKASEATVFVSRQPAGQAPPIPEARIAVSIVDGVANANVVCHEVSTYKLDPIRVGDADIVGVVLHVVVAARKLSL
ncbi:hypothetical protein R70006_03804 [Paraburkholderia domus]|uniref:hypothetical protein n=1 Tax=Paraburkholderia domus TaxID=2793075 RepID=UPI001911CE22|nr:hypothetical protein [Paraburkholderia domus]MBK5047268.1 hypothetical protein [Burkholderia sp. R-70006]CAE6767863.1 hypothetical protein R70006_03804 [Paraburkholderia domus]